MKNPKALKGRDRMRRGDSNRTWRRLRRRHTIAPRWAFRRWRGLEFPGLRPGLRDMTPSGSRCSAMPTGKVTQGGHTARHQRLGVKPSRIFGNSAANRRSGDHSRVTAGAAQPTTLGAAWLVRQAAEAVTSSVCASSLSPARWNSPQIHDRYAWPKISIVARGGPCREPRFTAIRRGPSRRRSRKNRS